VLPPVDSGAAVLNPSTPRAPVGYRRAPSAAAVISAAIWQLSRQASCAVR